MHCYNHSEDAVGICKSCGRALCRSCAAEVEKAVACKDRCESDVAAILSTNRNALLYAKTAKKARYLAPTLFVVMGIMFTTLGITASGIDLSFFAGAVVVAIGAALLVIQHKMAKGVKVWATDSRVSLS